MKRMKKISLSKSEYVDLCLDACRDDRAGDSVYLNLSSGKLVAEWSADMSRCEALGGTCDVSGYCEDIESDDAAEQVIECADANGDWETMANDLEADVTIEWID